MMPAVDAPDLKENHNDGNYLWAIGSVTDTTVVGSYPNCSAREARTSSYSIYRVREGRSTLRPYGSAVPPQYINHNRCRCESNGSESTPGTTRTRYKTSGLACKMTRRTRTTKSQDSWMSDILTSLHQTSVNRTPDAKVARPRRAANPPQLGGIRHFHHMTLHVDQSAVSYQHSSHGDPTNFTN